jgi:hypothetical protein
MAYFGARFGVLGVYVTGRTWEKQAGATGELPPTLIGELLKAIKNKKNCSRRSRTRRSDGPFIRHSPADS